MASQSDVVQKQKAAPKKDAVQVISRAGTEDALVEVIQYPVLRGSSDTRTAETLFFASHAGMRLKMVRITLKNSQVRLDPGALYDMKGDLEMKTSTGGGLLKPYPYSRSGLRYGEEPPAPGVPVSPSPTLGAGSVSRYAGGGPEKTPESGSPTHPDPGCL